MLFEGLRKIFEMAAVPAQPQGFPKTLTKSDFNLFGGSTQSLVPGVWNTIGTFVVPAQQKYRWGYGTAKEPENQGYIYIELRDSSNAVFEGMIRLLYSDASGLKRQVVYEERTNVLRGSTTDKRLKIPLPEKICELRQDGYAREDDRLIIEIRPDAAVTGHFGNSTVFLPATLVA